MISPVRDCSLWSAARACVAYAGCVWLLRQLDWSYKRGVRASERAGESDRGSNREEESMGWKETVTSGLRRFGEEAEKALDKGKTKVGELQTEIQMDGLAKKLGYLTYDAHRGRKFDEATRVKLLMDLTRLEDALNKAKAEAEAKADSDKAAKKPGA